MRVLVILSRLKVVRFLFAIHRNRATYAWVASWQTIFFPRKATKSTKVANRLQINVRKFGAFVPERDKVFAIVARGATSGPLVQTEPNRKVVRKSPVQEGPGTSLKVTVLCLWYPRGRVFGEIEGASDAQRQSDRLLQSATVETLLARTKQSALPSDSMVSAADMAQPAGFPIRFLLWKLS